MKAFYLLILLSWTFMVFGQERLLDKKQVRQAEVLFEAHEYLRAANSYQHLLQESYTVWERSLLSYNLGSVLIAEKRWNEAITTFGEVSIDNKTSPLLLFRLKTELAWAYWQLGLSALTQQNMKGADDALQSALQELALAQKAYCLLTYAEGVETCSSEPDLTSLQAMIQRQKLLTQQTPEAHSQGASLLLEGVKFMLSELDFIKDTHVQEVLKKSYMDLFVNKHQEELALWSIIKPTYVQKNSPKQQVKLFNEAEDQFKQAIVSIQQDHFEKGYEATIASKKALEQLLLLPPPSTSSQEQESSTSEESSPESATEKSMQNVLQLLLEMDQEDAPSSTLPVIEKEVERPW